MEILFPIPSWASIPRAGRRMVTPSASQPSILVLARTETLLNIFQGRDGSSRVILWKTLRKKNATWNNCEFAF